MFGRIAGLSGGGHRIELHGVIGDDDQVVARQAAARAGRAGRQLEVGVIQVWHARDDTAGGAWLSGDDLLAVDEFWF